MTAIKNTADTANPENTVLWFLYGKLMAFETQKGMGLTLNFLTLKTNVYVLALLQSGRLSVRPFRQPVRPKFSTMQRLQKTS